MSVAAKKIKFGPGRLPKRTDSAQNKWMPRNNTSSSTAHHMKMKNANMMRMKQARLSKSPYRQFASSKSKTKLAPFLQVKVPVKKEKEKEKTPEPVANGNHPPKIIHGLGTPRVSVSPISEKKEPQVKVESMDVEKTEEKKKVETPLSPQSEYMSAQEDINVEEEEEKKPPIKIKSKTKTKIRVKTKKRKRVSVASTETSEHKLTKKQRVMEQCRLRNPDKKWEHGGSYYETTKSGKARKKDKHGRTRAPPRMSQKVSIARNIRKERKNAHKTLSIAKIAFARVVREIAKDGTRFTQGALDAIQVESEAMSMELMMHAAALTEHSGRTQGSKDDIRVAIKLMQRHNPDFLAKYDY